MHTKTILKNFSALTALTHLLTCHCPYQMIFTSTSWVQQGVSLTMLVQDAADFNTWAYMKVYMLICTYELNFKYQKSALGLCVLIIREKR